jgi:hypothetical protein
LSSRNQAKIGAILVKKDSLVEDKMIQQPKVTAPLKESAYREALEYMASHMSPEDILAFKVSDGLQQRIEVLLNKNNSGKLSTAEKRELDEITEFNRLMVVIFARAAAAQKQVS